MAESSSSQSIPQLSKKKIKIKTPKTKITISNHTTQINLYDLNLDYLKKNFTDECLNMLKANYIIDPHKSKNIYHFIDAYRNVIKYKYNMELNFENYTLLEKINTNNAIKVVWGDCLDNLKALPCESIGHMVTSPPYYNAKQYSIWENLKSYLDDMRAIIQECYRVLDNHRVFVFNVSDVVGNDHMEKIRVFGNRKIPLPAYFICMFEECGFTFVDDIIWDKGEVQSSRHKSANKPYPFFQYPCNCYEHILVFHKHRLEKDIKYPCSECGSLEVKSNSYTCKGLRSWECRNSQCRRTAANRGKRFSLKTIMAQNPFRQQESIIPKEVFTSWRRDIHRMPPVHKIRSRYVKGPDGKRLLGEDGKPIKKKENVLGHTAPFPIDIPMMSIYYYSYKGDIVLDPFAGSFTSAIAAQQLGRIGIGFELRKDLFAECIRKNLKKNNCLFEEIE